MGRPPKAVTAAAATTLAALAIALLGPAPTARADEATRALERRIAAIDRAAPGRLGVYVKKLDGGDTVRYQSNRPWYLASAVKLPIAIALLEEVEAGRLALDSTVALQDSDRIDGAGQLVWQERGTRYSLTELMQRMLMQSDSTAADMLVRTIGPDRLQGHARDLLGRRGFERITSFAQVRRDVYGELYPAARRLSNPELVEVAGAPLGPQRVRAVQRSLGPKAGPPRVKTIDEAYARYYRRGYNAATLEGYGGMLERLVGGKLLTPEHREQLYKDLKFETYDGYRLEAGLPKSVRFIHKTGTQWQRACHAGVIEPQDEGRQGIVVVACAEGLDEQREAGRVFEQVGEAITATLLGGSNGR